jgi:hypothetical protein
VVGYRGGTPPHRRRKLAIRGHVQVTNFDVRPSHCNGNPGLSGFSTSIPDLELFPERLLHCRVVLDEFEEGAVDDILVGEFFKWFWYPQKRAPPGIGSQET